MNSKMTTNSQLLTTELKKKNENKLSKNQNWNRITEIEITWRVLTGGVGGGRLGEKVQGIRSTNGRYKIDRGRLRIV